MENLGRADWNDPERVKRLAASYSERYGEAFWQTMLKLTGTSQRDTIADLGCGPGLFLVDAQSRYGARKVIGLDASEVMLKQARFFLKNRLESKNITLRAVDFDSSATGLQAKSVDLAFSGFLLHEIHSPEGLLPQVYESLRPKGIYAVYEFVSGDIDAFVNHMMKSGMSEAEARNRYPHMCKYGLNDFEDMLHRAGFNQVESSLIDVRAVLVGLKGIK
jgi:ubiquinone/menaquinone biosynthesis C-methylase UbiE